MGALLSLNNTKVRSDNLYEVSHSEACKRQRTSSSFWEENPRLIPSLPDEISIQILARLPRICYLDMKLVSRSWKAVITGAEVFKLRKEFGTTEQWLYILTKSDGEKLVWFALDPHSKRWQRLPPMPNVSAEDGCRRGLSALNVWNVVGSSIKIADAVRGWLGRRHALDQIPFCGCAVAAVDGCLYVIGGFSKAVPMKCVRKYDPTLNVWSEVSSMSVEVFDPRTGSWSEVPSMPFSKAQVLPTAFLADLLKPIATGMTSYKGKLYVSQSLYCWPFFVDVGGEVYDPDTNSWVEMPVGMGEGWPARQAGTKVSVIVEDDLYALDPSSSLDSARIKTYDYEGDTWKVVDGDVPIRDFAESESPYLLSGLLGKLHVITKDANQNILVMQADKQNHLGSSASTADLIDGSLQESVVESETNIWTVIATKNASSAELISCQVLDM
ncbi:F-box/kelch-repeat protein family [Heracleum sosnowskyi]|uniref:F-box/kelch-repeat protein family n=1 Tax=Heracleum sosnowskyi TaxID=360622 RepID=A0AAD8H445_9APIA|nr:F-box/kelch-repeat protein family [Heracleum sosnowskyi]